jgi:hydrogenase maturation protease
MPSIEIDTPILVIGYGNELRGDDGAGPAAAKVLRRELPGNTVEVLTVHQLLPELSQRLSRSAIAIFIDADWTVPPGQICKKTLTANNDGAKTIGHHQSPEGLLTMADELYGHAPTAILFNVGAENFGFHQHLSKPVRRAIPKLVEQVVHIVQQAAAQMEHHHA